MWDIIKEISQSLLGNIKALILIVGVILVILGASGGITYGGYLIISNEYTRMAIGLLGVVLIAIAILLHVFSDGSIDDLYQRIDPKIYGVEITHPKNGDIVDVFNVDGSIKRQIPPGYEIVLIEFYPQVGRFRPVGHVFVDKTKNTWRAEGIEIYGKGQQTRLICVYLVGKAGMILLEYFRNAGKIHYETINALKAARAELNLDPEAAVQWLPLIPTRTPDMFECDHVSVTRKTRPD
ncbi:hypothetical protein U8P76_01720 [Rhizobium johnstonii]|uniref:hypothetical protein n=1 Tax=Rhizobium leguminosarum TaxID=384 RepID=UPI0013BF082E|nr:hypothetical protein [Rhizobium leguminosarum]WSG95785.1 hypothetical protein U8P76_01720 [Rhizobium johnstonii]NEH99228.1 hypothetical protein [Rhizobium leguminosarum]NEJ42312.1 hypothetical protein [Rhizobium leguminosarum]NEJ48879.1 hypothetical protein [Rhizobium leguminosarum]NEJ82548.1 hypothetical protein [Rhizobium leguminosarum]